MAQRLPLIAVLLASLTPATPQNTAVEFSRDIRPLLSDRCFECHGPDEANRKVNLRLDTEAGARQAIVPGDPASSAVYRRITADRATRMPPSCLPPHRPT